MRCKPGEVAKYVLLPGDPARVPEIAAHWDESWEVTHYREHVTYTGKVTGVEISSCSTGAGGPSTASAIEELAEIDAECFIRVGTCGALQEYIKPGDIIISSGAIRHDGTSNQYVDLHYPALADHEVTFALIEAAERLGKTYHVGIGYTSASFFCGQGRSGFNHYEQSWMKNIVSDAQKAGALNFEMEAATVFTLSKLFNIRAGAIFTVAANRVKDEFSYSKAGVENSILVAIEAVKILNEWDKLKTKANKRYLFPSLISN